MVIGPGIHAMVKANPGSHLQPLDYQAQLFQTFMEGKKCATGLARRRQISAYRGGAKGAGTDVEKDHEIWILPRYGSVPKSALNSSWIILTSCPVFFEILTSSSAMAFT